MLFLVNWFFKFLWVFVFIDIKYEVDFIDFNVLMCKNSIVEKCEDYF